MLFVYLELTGDNPLLDLRVFKYTTFTMANLTIVATTVGMFAGLFYLPLFLQSIRGIGAMETGLLMMPGALLSGVMMPITGWLYDRIGPRWLVVAGLLFLAGVTYLFHNLNLATATSTIIVWVMFRGMVLAFANMPAQTAALVDIPTELVGRASALTNIISRVSSSFGISVLTSILTSRQAFHEARLSWTLNAANPVAAGSLAKVGALMGGGAQGRGAALAYLQGMVARTAFVNAIDDVFLITAAFTLLALVPALFLKKGVQAGPGRAMAAE